MFNRLMCHYSELKVLSRLSCPFSSLPPQYTMWTPVWLTPPFQTHYRVLAHTISNSSEHLETKLSLKSSPPAFTRLSRIVSLCYNSGSPPPPPTHSGLPRKTCSHTTSGPAVLRQPPEGGLHWGKGWEQEPGEAEYERAAAAL